MNQILEVREKSFRTYKIDTQHAAILLIQGKYANLGCGYFSIPTADKLDDRFAVVTGVKTFDDMLRATVLTASKKALDCGVVPGSTTGEEALILMEKEI